MQRTEISPIAQITEKPNRKSRSETLLRILIASSYPHAFFSNLAIQLFGGHPSILPAQLETLAGELRDREKQLDILDFIRCIEIIKSNDRIMIEAKRLDGVVGLKAIIDNARNHVSFWTIDTYIGNDVLSEEFAQSLSHVMLTAYYKTHAIGNNKQKDVSQFKWAIKEKKSQPSTQKTVKHFKDMKSSITEERKVDFKEVQPILQKVLQGTHYHILLTRNAITVRDQGLRISLPDHE